MKLLKWLLVPVISFAVFLGYAYTLNFLSQIVPLPDKSNVTHLLIMLMLPSFLASVFVAVLSAYLLTFLYKHNAIWVAFFVSLPVLVLTFSGQSSFSNPTTGSLVVFYEMTAFLTLMLSSTFIVSKKAQALTHPSSGTGENFLR